MNASEGHFQKTLDRIFSLTDFERGSRTPDHRMFHLERIKLLLSRISNPHLDTPTIHIAGSKGKGSTAAMLTSILEANGYKTGLYTSPHLHRITERIRIGSEPIKRSQFSEIADRIWPEIECFKEHSEYGDITFFEFLTAMAFLYFKKEQVDFQVIEVGLGGRLDATNIVMPTISVITPIMLDHVSTLGNSIKLIAKEKAGIIKSNTPVIISFQKKEAMDVFQKIAKQKRSQIISVEKTVGIDSIDRSCDKQSFSLTTNLAQYQITTPLIGDHQQQNAATALATIEALPCQISPKAIVSGLKKVSWPARMQFFNYLGLRIIVDGAHNPESVNQFVKSVKQYFKYNKLIVIFGSNSNHDEQDMLKELVKLAPRFVSVQSRHPKSLSSKSVTQSVKSLGMPEACDAGNVGKGLSLATDIATYSDLILVTGSLAVAAEIIENIENIEPEVYPTIDNMKSNDKEI